MFGYVVANGKALTEEQLARYRGCYCGLCRTLKDRHGNLCRLTLNYDMTFLILLLGGMYEPEETSDEARCVIHPGKRRAWWRSRFTEYAADMNVALARHSCLDDYRDEKKLLSLAEAKMLDGAYAHVKALWPEQCAAIEDCMKDLTAIQSAPDSGPDDVSNRFGQMMGVLFAVEPDTVWAPRLRSLGESLGRFICMMDACVDLERDIKKGVYNPLIPLRETLTDEQKTGILKMLIGECTAQFETLPIVQDAGLLRNILNSGVWTRHTHAMNRKKEEHPHE